MKKIVELKRERILGNIEMKFLSDEQIRAINLNTMGGYEVHEIEYDDQIQRLYSLPLHDKWIWLAKYGDLNIPDNPVYQKARNVISELVKRYMSLPVCSEEESKKLDELLESFPDTSSKLLLIGLSYLSRSENDPIQKTGRTAFVTMRITREYLLKLVEKFENRMIIEKEYNQLMNSSVDELVECAFDDKYDFLNKIDNEGVIIKKGSTLELIINEFETFVPKTCFNGDQFINQMDTKMKDRIVKARDIYNFSVLIAQYQDADMFSIFAGHFLGYLVDHCIDDKITFKTKHLRETPNEFTIREDKEVEVFGNMGSVGRNMESGRLILYGNAGNYVGFHQSGGDIIIAGDCGDSLGYMMHGGSISVNGNAGKKIGNSMSGGEIYLYGDYKSLKESEDFYAESKLIIKCGGEVYHKGKLILRDGKIVKL